MKRILFVDDEPRVLDGLRRLLRPQRTQWDMLFATGGEEALILLEKSRVDVVVADMRMPGMDGADFLKRVYERYPEVTRIVLSGQFDTETGMRATPFAHQFLTKPCDPDKLKAALKRSGESCTQLPGDSARKVIPTIGALPSPPKVYVQLLEAVNDPGVSFDAISRIMSRDVALSAKVLQLANSAFFGLEREVANVREAITAFGLDVTKQLVVSTEILRQFRALKPNPHFSIEEFERHSRLTADIAVQLPGQADGNTRAMAALLHDTGKLVLASQLPDAFAEACKIAAEEAIPSYQAEERVFGTNHAEVGASLLNLWGLPQAMVDPIAKHHRPQVPVPRSKGLDLLAVVHIANALAHDRENKAARDGDWPSRLDREYIAQLGVDAEIPGWRSGLRGSGTA